MSTSSAKSFRGPPLHLLVFAYKQRLSGSVVADDGRREHVVHFVDGAPAKVATDGHIAPLLDVVGRLGLADPDALELERGTTVAPEDGWALVDRGLLDEPALMTARRWQVMRRLEHILNRPASTRYVVHEGEDLAEALGEPDLSPVDPLAVIMQGSRLMSSREVVDANVERYLRLRLCTRRDSKHDRLRLTAHEEAVVAALQAEPRRLRDLVQMGHDEETARRVLFGLIVAQGLARAADQGGSDSDRAPDSRQSSPGEGMQVPVTSSPGAPPAVFSVPPVSMVPSAPSRPPMVAAHPSAHPWPMEAEPEPTIPDGREDDGPILVDPDAHDDPATEPGTLHQRPTPKRPPPVPSAERFAFASSALRQGPVPVIESGSLEVPSESPWPGARPEPRSSAPSPRAGYGPTGTMPPGYYEEHRPLEAPSAAAAPSPVAPEGPATTSPVPVAQAIPHDHLAPPAMAAPEGPATTSRPGEVVAPDDAPPLPPWGHPHPHPSPAPATFDPAPSHPPTFDPAPSHPPTFDPAPSHPPTFDPQPSRPATFEPAPFHPPTSEPAPSHPPTSEPASSHPPTSEPASSHPPTSHPSASHPSLAGAFGGMGRVEVSDAVRDAAMRHFFAAEEALKVLDRDRAERELARALSMIPGEGRFEVLRLWIEAERLGLPASNQSAKESHYKAQLAELDAICERAPRLEEAFYYRGRLLKRSGRLKEAMADFKQAAKLNPSNLDAAREVRDYEERRNRRRRKSGEEEVPSGKKLQGIRSEAENKVAEVADFFKGVLRRGRD